MKKNEKIALRAKEVGEIGKTLGEKRVELGKIIAESYGGKEKNLKKAKNLRRDIAQILTIIKEKEYIEQTAEQKNAEKNEKI